VRGSGERVDVPGLKLNLAYFQYTIEWVSKQEAMTRAGASPARTQYGRRNPALSLAQKDDGHTNVDPGLFESRGKRIRRQPGMATATFEKP